MEEKQKTNEKETWAIAIIIIFTVIFLLFSYSAKKQRKVDIQLDVKESIAQYLSENTITKDTFRGSWPFVVDKVQVYCVDLKSLTGASVKINDNEYAITRNISDLPFLPYSQWLDAEYDGIHCTGVPIEKHCKVPLYDVIKYAETICHKN